jgi:hypothetical protein
MFHRYVYGSNLVEETVQNDYARHVGLATAEVWGLGLRVGL